MTIRSLILILMILHVFSLHLDTKNKKSSDHIYNHQQSLPTTSVTKADSDA
jgi:hypothetical protein